MKRHFDDSNLCTGSSHHNFFSLICHADILQIVSNIDNEEAFSRIVANVFTESFIVVEKEVYNKSTINTLTRVGLVNDVAACLIRFMVIQFVLIFQITKLNFSSS